MKPTLILSLLMLVGHQLTMAAPLTTAFNYTGQLQISGLPTNGLFDFQFAVGAAESGGWLAGPHGIEDVPVSNGVFSVSIDFGETVFNGDRRWLEIAVRPGESTGAFTPLSPRQELAPTPYALYAKKAARAEQVQWSDILGLPTGFADGEDADTLYGAGAGLSLSSNTFSIPLSGVNNGMLAGAIALSKLNAAGASTGQVIKYDGTKWGIGTDNGGTLFSAGEGLILFDNVLALGTVPLNHISAASATPGSSLMFDGTAVTWGSPSLALALPFAGTGYSEGSVFAIQNNLESLPFGGVAISGTSAYGGDGVRGQSTAGNGVRGLSINGAGVRGLHTGGSGLEPGVLGSTDSTSDNAAGVKGEVRSATPGYSSAGVLGINHSVDFVGDGVFGLHLGRGFGVHGECDNGVGVYGRGVNNIGVFGEGEIAGTKGFSSHGFGVQGSTSDGTGVFGSNFDSETTGHAGYFEGRVRVTKSLRADSGLEGQNAAGFGVIGRSTTGTGIYGDNGNSDTEGHAGYFNGRVRVTQTLTTKVLTITGGADVAEPFRMSSAGIAPGSVVIIDEKSPGQLKMSERAFDRRVAGIVSGANGINPGITLHQEGAIEGGQNVALSGRVYVLADCSAGDIEPGDLLTTSDRPGHAMKVTDFSRARGAILGKAMGSLTGENGLVLVLVTLQ